MFQWLADNVENVLHRNIQERLEAAGATWLSLSRSLAPVKSGFLRAEEGYTVANGVLTLTMGAYYDIFQEFGTRNIRPHPHVRPALNAMSRILGSEVVMDFNTLGPSAWGGIHYVHTSTGKAGRYVQPSRIQPKPLTGRQKQHVREHLLPSGAALHTGNVKRAKFKVRRHGS